MRFLRRFAHRLLLVYHTVFRLLLCARSGLSRISFHGRRVPGMRCLQMLSIGKSPKLFGLAGRSPDFYRSLSPALGEAPYQGWHVANMIGMKVSQEHFRCCGHRKFQSIEMCQGARTKIKEEEVALLISHLDKHGCRRLA